MSRITRTATVTALTEEGEDLQTLFAATLAGKFNEYEDVILINYSDVEIEIASMEGNVTPEDGDYITIGVGGEVPLSRISARDFWVRTTSAAGAHDLRFIGHPANN